MSICISINPCLKCFRIDMETEEILYGNRSSPSLGGYHGHQSDNAKQTAIRTSFFALRNNILEELKNTNSDTVRLICANSSTKKKKKN